MANLQEGIRQSLDVIRANKGRAFLTMLGINFGVLSLIAISIIGLSFRASITSVMGQYGSELMWVMVNDNAYISGEAKTALDRSDITYFSRSLPGLLYYTTFFINSTTASYRGENQRVTVYGINADYFKIFAASKEIARGRALLWEDDFYHRPVCVLGPEIAALLFGDEDPLGKYIKLFDRVFQVVGITRSTEMSFITDGTNDSTIYIPEVFISSLIWQGRQKKYYFVMLKFENLEQTINAEVLIENYLNKKYGLLRGIPRFRIMKFDTFIQITNNVLDIISLLILVISAISLLVGGLGIMNIMLVTVTERTQEIGIRMAVGARRRDILIQFLIEAVTMCLIGGGLGVFLGALLASLVCYLAGWPFIISLLSVINGLSISTAIGVIFGLYPAWKASKLTPIEALRVEI